MRTAPRIPTALGYAVASAVLVGLSAEILALLLPAKRCVALDRESLVAAARLAAVGWAGVAVAVVLLVGRTEAVARALLCFAVLAALPLCKDSLALKLAAGRLAYPAWLFLAGAGSTLVFVRAEAAALARRVGPLAWMLPLAAALVLISEAMIDRAMVLECGFVPENADLASVAAMFGWNTLLVLTFVALLHPFVNRPAVTSVLSAAILLGLAACDVVKLSYLKAPLHPLDVLYVGELRAPGGGLLQPVWLAAVAGGLAVTLGAAVWCWRLRWGASRPISRGVIALLAGALLVVAAQVSPPGADSFRWDPRRSSLENGLFAQMVVDLQRARVFAPRGYGREAVLEVARRRTAERAATADARGPLHPPGSSEPPDVVVLAVESLMDPLDMSPELPDPLPFVRELAASARKGHAISPVFGGQSANAEFELLTGFSMRFLPRGTLPYEQFVRHDLPALPRTFAEHGYHACAVLADPPTFYDRPRCYPLLGFQDVRWLEEEPGVERARNHSPTDRAVVEAVLEAVGGAEPAFVFAFTNATHSPYSDPEDGTALEAGLVGENARESWAGYSSALQGTDRALRRLVEGLRASPRPSVLLVVGDHLPPFPGPDGLYEELGFFRGEPRGLWRRRQSSLALLVTSPGAGRELPPSGEPAELEVDMSYLGLELLAAAGLAPEGHWAILAALRDAYPIVNRQPIAEVEPPEAMRDYALLQYDLLFGGRHLLAAPGGAPHE